MSIKEKFLEAVEEPVHEFQIMTSRGPATLKLAHSEMNRCPCGSERFAQQFNVGYWKEPGVLNGPTVQCQNPIFVCVKCDRELLPTDAQIGKKIVEGER